MTHLTILHTNDLHGRVEQLARIATLARRIRREAEASGGYCVFWDAGDAEDSVLVESSVTKGGAAIALLRAAGCDLAVLGNTTPMRYGPRAIQGLVNRFGKPLLAANLFDAQTGQLFQGLTPFVVQTFGDIRVGIIGLTAVGKIYSVFKDVRLGDPLALLPGLIEQVRARGAQTVVLLSHLGFQTDRQVAEHVRGLDVIIGGHSHTEVNPPLVVNGTIIAQTGDYGRLMGRLDLEISVEGKIIHHHGDLIPVGADIPLDAQVQAAFSGEQASVQQMMLRRIGELRETVGVSDTEECAAGNLLADALLARVRDAEIALVLKGHWTSGLEAGPLTLGALNAALRSTANPARVELTGEQVVQFLREAFKPENAARRPHNMRGVALGLPHVAGMSVRYAPDKLDVTVAGEPLQTDRTYLVAGTDLEFWDAPGYPGYLALAEEQIELEVPTIMAEVVEEYIATRSPLAAPTLGRLEIVPPPQ